MKIRKLSAYQVRKNLWRCYGMDPITQSRKAFYGATKQEAENRARASYNDLVPSKNLTFAQYYFDYFLPTLVYKSQNWQLQICWAYDKYLIPTFGNHPMADITRIQIQRFFNSIAGQFRPATLGKLKICLSATFNLAILDGVIPTNPCSRIELPSQDTKGVDILSFAEMADLFMAGDNVVKSFILIQLAAGLRIGECCGLMLDDLSTSGKLKIQRQVLQPPGGAVLTDVLKTSSTRRAIQLPHELAILLRRHSAGSVFFLGNDRGAFALPNNVSRALEKTRLHLGMRKITCHQFRHTVISQLLLRGCPGSVVQQITGKSTQKGDVLGTYSHATDADIEKWLGTILAEFLSELDRKLS